MTAEKHENAGADALMAAITGELPPPEAGEDAALLAEYRSAAADVALLREQLGIIAGALTEPEPAARPVPVRAPRRGRRGFSLALGAVAVACAATVVSGLAWITVQAGDGMGGSADSSSDKSASQADGASRDAPQELACARLVVEGTVTALRPLPGDPGRERVTLRVIRSYQPAGGRAEITVLRDDSTAPAVRGGDHVLVVGRHSRTVVDTWSVGDKEVAAERARITRALAGSPGTSCG
ncbi:hypothetical protein ABZT03_35415 [Streptomyces sp. NPDC005574]|uniref:hypothetical protein n=1 Tax=Streptomyces sp. NPDC005574 TaxID=3156891 RepID=UPI0033A04A33